MTDASTLPSAGTAAAGLACDLNAFFHFNLEVPPDGGTIWLRITGRAGVKAFLEGAFAPGDSHVRHDN